jgi:hypothetical protein
MAHATRDVVFITKDNHIKNADLNAKLPAIEYRPTFMFILVDIAIILSVPRMHLARNVNSKRKKKHPIMLD